MDRDNVNVSRDKIAGFMLGVSVGVGIGMFLKHPDETRLQASNEGNDNLKRHSDHFRSQRTDQAKKHPLGRPE